MRIFKMNKDKADFFLQDLAAYRAGDIDEASMIENLKYFLNEDESVLSISQEDFDALLANYESFDAMLAYYEGVAKELLGKKEEEVVDEEAVV